jgi:hypothetical protein
MRKLLYQNKIIFMLLFIIISFSTCKSYDTQFKSQQDTILYAVRQDSITSDSDKVHFYLNGKKIVELNTNSYAALHLKPGKYTVRWMTYDENDKLLTKKEYSGYLKGGEANQSLINHAFFGWRGWDKFDTDMQGAMLAGGVKLVEEKDLRNIIRPQ